ncbi:hypothetical protein MMC26_006011 [Xylographa opegraphella]|nr:hypothetical protein [Xylographa opegraphella]
MPGGRGNPVTQRRARHDNQMPAHNLASPHFGRGWWAPRIQGGRANNRAPRQNSEPQTTRPNHNYIRHGAQSSRSRRSYRQSHSNPRNRRSSTTSTVRHQRSYTAPSRPNNGSRALYRDIYSPKPHSKVRALISEGSLLSRKVQDFLKEIEFILLSDPEEMDWDHTDQKEVVSDGAPRKEWEHIKPEVKNPFDKETRQSLQTKLPVRLKTTDGPAESNFGGGLPESRIPDEVAMFSTGSL